MAGLLMTVGKVAFALVGAAGGVSLARATHAERGLRVHSWGCAMIFVGGMGIVWFAVGQTLAVRMPGHARGLLIAGELAQVTALGLLFVFVWRYFRPGERWAQLLAGLGILALGVTFVGEVLVQTWPHHDPRASTHRAMQLTFVVPFVWSYFETRAQSRRSRKQVELGITAAAVAHRFRLWSLASAAFAEICLVALAASFLPPASASHELSVALRGALYLAATGALWLAFFPPAAYAKRFASIPAAEA